MLLSMIITITAVPLFMKLAVKLNVMDTPNERNVHPYPIPRCGGMAMALGAVVPVILWANGDKFIRIVLAGAGILFIFGLIDDFRNLGYKIKFIGQFAVALIFIE